jgi:hypothetical protein
MKPHSLCVILAQPTEDTPRHSCLLVFPADLPMMTTGSSLNKRSKALRTLKKQQPTAFNSQVLALAAPPPLSLTPSGNLCTISFALPSSNSTASRTHNSTTFGQTLFSPLPIQ